MAMRPCQQCLDNRWAFDLKDGIWVEATCQSCGHEVVFMSTKARKMQNRAYRASREAIHAEKAKRVIPMPCTDFSLPERADDSPPW